MWADILKLIIIMGAATIAENSIKNTTASFWNRLPQLPSIKALDFDLKDYNKSFVNFAMLVGIVAIGKSTLAVARKAMKRPDPVPTKLQLLDKYGHLAWALITDCKDNLQYCKFLAANGFNLILMGQDADITKAKEIAVKSNPEVRIETITVNWTAVQIDLKYYQGLLKHLQHHDIAFMVLPKLKKEKDSIPSHLEHIQPFEHIYLLVRYFGVKLKFRSYRSAIIFPSYPDAEEAGLYNGVSQGLIAGSDAFGRIISYELKGTVEVVVARGSVQNAFAGLGIQKITY